MPRAQKPGLTFETMMSVERVSDPVVSPDGTRVVFVTAIPRLAENSTHRTLRLLDLRTGEQRELTPGPGDHTDPAWSPDGNLIAFVSTRSDKDGAQIWILPTEGGEARQITSGYGGAHAPVWAPDSRRLAFWRTVVVSADYRPKPGAAVDPKKGPSTAEVHGLDHPLSSARIADGLLFRHWDTWRERRRQHVFLVDIESRVTVDVTPFDCDSPPISLGSPRDFAFHPSGREMSFVMNPDAVVARSTNNSIYLQEIRGVKPVGAPRCISDSEANDCHPRYSPDGRFVFYLAMTIPGYEADRFRIKQFDRESEKTEVHLERFDRAPSEFHFADGETLVFVAEDRGRKAVYRYSLATKKVVQLTDGTYNGLVRVIPGSKDLLVSRERTTQPADLFRLTPGAGVEPRKGAGGTATELASRAPSARAKGARGTESSGLVDAGATVTQLTHFRDAVADVSMNDAEEFWFEGADKDPVHGFLVRPAGVDSGRKIPLILLIHGGPQTAFADHFHYRWNAQVFASRGAAVAFINPRGSTGYGQRFTDQISGDWGGRCYRDLMLGVDFLLSHYSFLDAKRVAAAGASFGGFMVNWIAGHTDRFRALVSHDGIFQAETMAYTTEELWFDEYEHGGLPHEKRNTFLKWSPHLHVQNFKTPTLVVQGGQDFRCPESEGVAMFQALQVMGVPSRFLYFPDEGHWVMQPANAQVWYDQVTGWLMKHIEA